jgi:hypothetical protein
MKARKRLVAYDDHETPAAWALLAYILVISLLLLGAFAAISPSAINYGDWYSIIENAVRSLASLVGLV